MSEQNSPPEPEGNGPNPWVKSLMIWGGIFLALLLVVIAVGGLTVWLFSLGSPALTGLLLPALMLAALGLRQLRK